MMPTTFNIVATQPIYTVDNIGPMPRLELYDTVVLKADRKLYGTVQRVHLDDEEALDDCLFIEHVPVDPGALTTFVTTGTPPKGYVFVLLSDVRSGNVLVREDEVELIDRSFELGDFVTQQGSSMLGSIIDFTETFVLRPLWKSHQGAYPSGWAAIAADDPKRPRPHHCTQSCAITSLPIEPDVYPPDLIFGVPGKELRKESDIEEGGLLIQDDVLGSVDDLAYEVTILMEDGSIVIVDNAEELYVPLPNFGDKRLVSLPEFDPDIRRPDLVVAQHGWSATMPITIDYISGQLVVTNGRNLRLGRWLHGKYDNNLDHTGRIIDVRSRDISARWIATNPFHSQHGTGDHPDEYPDQMEIDLYENLHTFPHRSELRRDKSVMLFDPSRTPQELEDRRRNKAVPTIASKGPRPVMSTSIQVGSLVKFRDNTAATIKYQGWLSNDGTSHGTFERISPATVFGFDLNVLETVYTQQEITVRWQDGTVSTQQSRSLQHHDLFEQDIMPAEMVVAREGMTQIPLCMNSSATNEFVSVPYNEMTVFERLHELHPRKVGIIQSVDPIERVAQVRWYKNPSIRLRGADHSILDASSRLGQLHDHNEDVSLYEILTFPALTRHLKDIAMIAPRAPYHRTFTATKREEIKSGVTNVSALEPEDRLVWARNTAAAVVDFDSVSQVSDKAVTASDRQVPDWCGYIVSLNTDGTVVMRMNVGEYSTDVVIEHDQFILHIDEAALTDADAESSEFMQDENSQDGSWSDSSNADIEPISETIEYEGGHRLDDDSDDANWDDEDDEDNDIEMADANTVNEAATAASLSERNPPQRTTSDTNSATLPVKRFEVAQPQGMQRRHDNNYALSGLCSKFPQEQPPQFAVLDTPIPSDQFDQNQDSPTTSTTFTKRILKEHKILATSLPKGEIYVRTYENRLDLMRCLIIGPADTPYEYAPFVFDLQFTSRFPDKPPIAHFHSWTHGLGRINPNLYEEGKICLSLLGTWQGKGENESWTEKATVLQLLVSLQGLVFVSRPFYNEAGYEEDGANDTYRNESLRYNEKALVMARAFVKHALQNVIGGLEDILAWTYFDHPHTSHTPHLLKKVIDRAQHLIEETEDHRNKIDDKSQPHDSSDLVDGAGSCRNDRVKAFIRLPSKGAIVMLKRTLQDLKEIDAFVHQSNMHFIGNEQDKKQLI